MEVNVYSLNTSSIKSIEALLRNIDEQELLMKFNLTAGTQVSLSRALREVIGNHLIREGWKANYQISSSDKNNIINWKIEYADIDTNTYLDVEVGHYNGIGKKTLKAIKMGQLKKSITYVIISISDDFKRDGNFDNSASTAKDIYNYLTEFKDNISIPVIVIELLNLKTFFIKSQEDSGGKFGKVVEVGK